MVPQCCLAGARQTCICEPFLAVIIVHCFQQQTCHHWHHRGLCTAMLGATRCPDEPQRRGWAAHHGKPWQGSSQGWAARSVLPC